MRLTGYKFGIDSLLLAAVVCCLIMGYPAGVLAQGEVSVVEVVSGATSYTKVYTTKLQPVHQVAVKPRIDGVVESVQFVEGQVVSKGDLLFKLESMEQQLEFQRLQTTQAVLESSLDYVIKQRGRLEAMSKSRLVAEQELDLIHAEHQQLLQRIAEVKVQLAQAKVALNYTEIRAPIGGRISRVQVMPGNTVKAMVSELTDIVSIGKLHAYFAVEEKDWLAGVFDSSDLSNILVEAELVGSANLNLYGQVDFINNKISVNTGRIEMRATVDVPDERVRAGALARLKVFNKVKKITMLVPRSAIISNSDGDFVLILDAEQKALRKKVTLGRAIGGLKVVLDGLQGGEKVTLNGAARVVMGKPIKTKLKTLNSLGIDAAALGIEAMVSTNPVAAGEQRL